MTVASHHQQQSLVRIPEVGDNIVLYSVGAAVLLWQEVAHKEMLTRLVSFGVQ